MNIDGWKQLETNKYRNKKTGDILEMIKDSRWLININKNTEWEQIHGNTKPKALKEAKRLMKKYKEGYEKVKVKSELNGLKRTGEDLRKWELTHLYKEDMELRLQECEGTYILEVSDKRENKGGFMVGQTENKREAEIFLKILKGEMMEDYL